MEDTIEGRNPVLEALRSGRPISKILMTKNIERHSAIAEILHLAQTRGIPVDYVERQAIDRQSRTGATRASSPLRQPENIPVWKSCWQFLRRKINRLYM